MICVYPLILFLVIPRHLPTPPLIFPLSFPPSPTLYFPFHSLLSSVELLFFISTSSTVLSAFISPTSPLPFPFLCYPSASNSPHAVSLIFLVSFLHISAVISGPCFSEIAWLRQCGWPFSSWVPCYCQSCPMAHLSWSTVMWHRLSWTEVFKAASYGPVYEHPVLNDIDQPVLKCSNCDTVSPSRSALWVSLLDSLFLLPVNASLLVSKLFLFECVNSCAVHLATIRCSQEFHNEAKKCVFMTCDLCATKTWSTLLSFNSIFVCFTHATFAIRHWTAEMCRLPTLKPAPECILFRHTWRNKAAYPYSVPCVDVMSNWITCYY